MRITIPVLIFLLAIPGQVFGREAGGTESATPEGRSLLSGLRTGARFEGTGTELLPGRPTWREVLAEEAPEPDKEPRGGRRKGFFRSPTGIAILVVTGAVIAGSVALNSLED